MYRSRERREYTPRTLDDYTLKLRDFLTAEGSAQQLQVTFPQLNNDLYSYIEKLGIDGVSFAGTTLIVSPTGFQSLVARHQDSLDKYTDWIIPQLQASEEQTLELEISSQIGLLQAISWICSLQQAPVPGTHRPSTRVYQLNGQDAQPVVRVSITENNNAPVLKVVTMGVNRGNANFQNAELKQAPVTFSQRPSVEDTSSTDTEKTAEVTSDETVSTELRQNSAFERQMNMFFSYLKTDGSPFVIREDLYPLFCQALREAMKSKQYMPFHGVAFEKVGEGFTAYTFETVPVETQQMITGQLVQRLEESERLKTVEESKINKSPDTELENVEVAVAEVVKFVASMSQMHVTGYGLEIDSERMSQMYTLVYKNSHKFMGRGPVHLGRFTVQEGDNEGQFYLNFNFEYGDNPESIAAAARAFLSELMS